MRRVPLFSILCLFLAGMICHIVRGESAEVDVLHHRLKPGDALCVTIHADRDSQPVPRQILGVSAHRIGGWTGLPYNREGAYRLNADYETAIRDLQLPMTRYK